MQILNTPVYTVYIYHRFRCYMIVLGYGSRLLCGGATEPEGLAQKAVAEATARDARRRVEDLEARCARLAAQEAEAKAEAQEASRRRLYELDLADLYYFSHILKGVAYVEMSISCMMIYIRGYI